MLTKDDNFNKALVDKTKEVNVNEINRSGSNFNASAEDRENINSIDGNSSSNTSRIKEARVIRAREELNQRSRLGDRGSKFGTVYSDRGTTGGNERESNGSDVRTDNENIRSRSIRSENDEMDSSRGQDELSKSYDSSRMVQSTIVGRRTDNGREAFTDRSESLGVGEVETNERKGNESIEANAPDSRGSTRFEKDISNNNGNLQKSGATINEEVYGGSESRSNTSQQRMDWIDEYESTTNRRNSENNVVEDTTNLLQEQEKLNVDEIKQDS